MSEAIIVIEPEHRAELQHRSTMLPREVPAARFLCLAHIEDALPLCREACAIIAKSHRVDARLVAAMPNCAGSRP